MQPTLVLFKTDCVRRGLIGECLARFERRGFWPSRLVLLKPSQTAEKLKAHYSEHEGKSFYDDLIAMMSRGPIVACVLVGDEEVVRQARLIAGPYKDPVPGTIRGDFATSPMDNLVHTSEDALAAARELKIWFPELYDCG